MKSLFHDHLATYTMAVWTGSHGRCIESCTLCQLHSLHVWFWWQAGHIKNSNHCFKGHGKNDVHLIVFGSMKIYLVKTTQQINAPRAWSCPTMCLSTLTIPSFMYCGQKPCFAKSKTYSEWSQMAICHPWKHQEKINFQWQHHNNKSNLCKGSFQIPKSQTTTNNQRTTTKLNHLMLECAPSPPPPPKKKENIQKQGELQKWGRIVPFYGTALKQTCAVLL